MFSFLDSGNVVQRPKYRPIDPSSLEAARRLREKEVRMYGVLKEIGVYALYLWILFILSYGNRDPNSFYLREAVINNFIKPGDLWHDFNNCNNRIVMAQRKHLDDFLRGRIIGRLECGRTQLEVSEELGIAQSVLSRLWQRFQDYDNKQTKHSIRPVSSARFSYRYDSFKAGRVQTLRHIGLYARRPVRCVPLTATHCRLRLTWNREHALWTPQQWSCVTFSDKSGFSLQSDSHRTLIWRAPGTR
ncbi:transposable element Tcb1 transposase [Trichonephila clavipes]|nr:transposable element Tcb1 transposase [Trichonephila clavipes]